MAKQIPMQNASAAAYLEIENSDVEFSESEGPGGKPVVRVIVGGPVGQLGMSVVPLAEGLNVLDADEYKKAIITLDDDSIVVGAIAELPEVTDDTTEAYQRTFRNTTAFDVTVRSGGNDYVMGAGLNQALLFMTGGIEAAVNGV